MSTRRTSALLLSLWLSIAAGAGRITVSVTVDPHPDNWALDVCVTDGKTIRWKAHTLDGKQPPPARFAPLPKGSYRIEAQLRRGTQVLYAFGGPVTVT